MPWPWSRERSQASRQQSSLERSLSDWRRWVCRGLIGLGWWRQRCCGSGSGYRSVRVELASQEYYDLTGAEAAWYEPIWNCCPHWRWCVSCDSVSAAGADLLMSEQSRGGACGAAQGPFVVSMG